MIKYDHPKKLHAGPVVHKRIEPFKHSLKYLYNLSADKWLLRYVTIRYFARVQLTFTGQISCVSNNGQIRLQYIRYTTSQHTNAEILDFIDPFHSFWFHYKQIDIILHKNKDVTAEILDILKMKIAQSFIYFNEFKALQKENALKVLGGTCCQQYIQQIIEMKNGILISSEFAKKARTFLFDIDRPNKYLVLKKNVYLNEQRRLVEWSKSDICKIVHYYKELFVKQLLKSMHIHNKEEKQKEIEYKSYLFWDNVAIRNEIKKELIRSENTMALLVYNCKKGGVKNMENIVKLKLYNVSKWGIKNIKPYIRNPRKYGKYKWIPQQNKYLSSTIKKKKINKQTNRFHHGNKHKQFKRQKKKRKRLSAKQEAIFQFEAL